jgi:hypothetical protein
MRKRLLDALWAISDRLCAHRLTFEVGHWIGELGWSLRAVVPNQYRTREAARQWWLEHPEEARKAGLPPDGHL